MFWIGILVSLLFAVANGSATVTDCSDGQSQFQVTFLDISPQLIVPSTPVNLMLLYTNPGPEITDGTVKTSITWNYIPIEPSSGPLCSSAKCPLVVGENNGSATTAWPDVTGIIVSRDEWFDVNGKLLLCIEMSVTTGAGFDFKNATECPVVNRWKEMELLEARYFRGGRI